MTDADQVDPADTGDLGHTSLRAALVASLESTPRLPRDAGAVKLLLHYADLLDDATDRLSDAAEEEETRDFGRMVTVIAKLGPRLEAMLDRLGMAPGARRPADNGGGGGDGNGRPDPAAAALAALRDNAGPGADGAAAGVDYAAVVDPAVTEADTAD